MLWWVRILLPHCFGHVFGVDPIDVPVKVEDVAAVSMAPAGDSSAACDVVAIGNGEMALVKDIATGNVSGLVVGQVYDGGRSFDVRKLCGVVNVLTVWAPSIDDVADGLLRIGYIV